jgi:hypothetical protein
MPKLLLPLLLSLCLSYPTLAQRPKDGTYKYNIAYWEWGGKARNATCTVVIKGDSVLVLSNGEGENAGEKGSSIDGGRLMYHKKSGKWIIGHRPEAKNAPKVGGCAEGPTVIEFGRRRVWLC